MRTSSHPRTLTGGDLANGVFGPLLGYPLPSGRDVVAGVGAGRDAGGLPCGESAGSGCGHSKWIKSVVWVFCCSFYIDIYIDIYFLHRYLCWVFYIDIYFFFKDTRSLGDPFWDGHPK